MRCDMRCDMRYVSILTVALVVLLAGIVGCEKRGKEEAEMPKARSDTVMTAELDAKMLADSQLRGLDIVVSTKDAVIQITGKVPSNELKKKAETIAGTVAGAKAIKSKLKVTGLPAAPVGDRSDSDIQIELKAKLLADSELSGWAINTEVIDGTIIMTGIVDSENLKRKAGKLAKTVAGAKDIENNLAIRPEEAMARKDVASDTAIEKKIKAKYAMEGALRGSRIKVTVKDGSVTLTGTVGSVDQKRVAEKIAKETEGVKQVRNDLEVKEEAEEPTGG